METGRLAELKAHSFKLGSNPDLVQGSGGNTSWKSDRTVWVKGSGRRLKDATSEEIFSSINFTALSTQDILLTQDFSKLASNDISPSIEANIHIFLRSPFVSHLHSLGSIAIGVSERNYEFKTLYENVIFVPYARPGIELVNVISRIKEHENKILVLQNHGLIICGQESGEIESKIEMFENQVSEYFTQILHNEELPNWIDILTSGVLTPDEAVFLGETPFTKSEEALSNSVGINSKGELLFPGNFSVDRVEIAKFFTRVAKLIERKTSINYLSKSEVHDLLEWDKEKIRIAMAK